MDLFSKSNIKKILKKYNIRPLKRLGQNFLIDKMTLKKLIKSAELNSDDVILEIGPGIGTITQEIAKKAKKVIAVEKDKKICEILKKTLKDFKNVLIVQKDILDFKISNFQFPISNQFSKTNFQYKIIGNLPFYITSPAIRRFLESQNPPKEMILIIQKEVAQRICASSSQVFGKQKFGRTRPPRMNFLAVCVQFFAEPGIISYVSKKSFYPQPDVDAAIIKIVSRQFHVPVSRHFREQFFKIVSAGFSQPRKYLKSNLSKKLNLDKEKVEKWLLKNNISPKQRAETLTISDWLNLTKTHNRKLYE